jgi:hypothetical protein
MKASEVGVAVGAVVMVIMAVAQRACETVRATAEVGTATPDRHALFGGATGQSSENDPNVPHTYVAKPDDLAEK